MQQAKGRRPTELAARRVVTAPRINQPSVAPVTSIPKRDGSIPIGALLVNRNVVDTMIASPAIVLRLRELVSAGASETKIAATLRDEFNLKIGSLEVGKAIDLLGGVDVLTGRLQVSVYHPVTGLTGRKGQRELPAQLAIDLVGLYGQQNEATQDERVNVLRDRMEEHAAIVDGILRYSARSLYQQMADNEELDSTKVAQVVALTRVSSALATTLIKAVYDSGPIEEISETQKFFGQINPPPRTVPALAELNPGGQRSGNDGVAGVIASGGGTLELSRTVRRVQSRVAPPPPPPVRVNPGVPVTPPRVQIEKEGRLPEPATQPEPDPLTENFPDPPLAIRDRLAELLGDI